MVSLCYLPEEISFQCPLRSVVEVPWCKITVTQIWCERQNVHISSDASDDDRVLVCLNRILLSSCPWGVGCDVDVMLYSWQMLEFKDWLPSVPTHWYELWPLLSDPLYSVPCRKLAPHPSWRHLSISSYRMARVLMSFGCAVLVGSVTTTPILWMLLLSRGFGESWIW